MNKAKIRIILALLTLMSFGASLFGVLYAEERKRLAKASKEQEEILQTIQEADRSRREYFEGVQKQREALRQKMGESQTEYEKLIKEQPDLIAGQKKTETQVTQQVVPVKTQETVVVGSGSTSSKPKSSRKTKSS